MALLSRVDLDGGQSGCNRVGEIKDFIKPGDHKQSPYVGVDATEYKVSLVVCNSLAELEKLGDVGGIKKTHGGEIQYNIHALFFVELLQQRRQVIRQCRIILKIDLENRVGPVFYRHDHTLQSIEGVYAYPPFKVPPKYP